MSFFEGLIQAGNTQNSIPAGNAMEPENPENNDPRPSA